MHRNHRNPKDKPDDVVLDDYNRRKKYWANYQIRRRRRRERRLIIHEEWDEIRTLPEPNDFWLWD